MIFKDSEMIIKDSEIIIKNFKQDQIILKELNFKITNVDFMHLQLLQFQQEFALLFSH